VISQSGYYTSIGVSREGISHRGTSPQSEYLNVEAFAWHSLIVWILNENNHSISDWPIGNRDENLCFDHSLCTVSLSGPHTTSVFTHGQLYVAMSWAK
jgi:hypothetical protein